MASASTLATPFSAWKRASASAAPAAPPAMGLLPARVGHPACGNERRSPPQAAAARARRGAAAVANHAAPHAAWAGGSGQVRVRADEGGRGVRAAHATILRARPRSSRARAANCSARSRHGKNGTRCVCQSTPPTPSCAGALAPSGTWRPPRTSGPPLSFSWPAAPPRCSASWMSS